MAKWNSYPCRSCGSHIDHSYFECLASERKKKEAATTRSKRIARLSEMLLEVIETKDEKLIKEFIQEIV